MKKMRISALALAMLIMFLGCNKKESVHQEEIPGELERKLVELEGHLPYYFPEREELGDLTDGVYLGELQGGMIDRGEVQVTIEGGVITHVQIINIVLMAPDVKREDRQDEVFQGLPNQVLQRQSPHVDAVSGATGSTHVFQVCVTRALWQASEGSDPMEPYSPY